MEKIKVSNFFKYNSEDNSATMLIYSNIGYDEETESGICGEEFAKEMLYLESMGVEKVCIRINSQGGSVIDGFSILSAIINSKMETETCIDGMAFSMAGIIAVCANKVCMSENAIFMMHNPSGSTDEVLLQKIKDSLVNILTKKTGMKKQAISKLMDSTTWLNAKECLDLGLIDEIEMSESKINVEEEIYNLYNSYLKNNTQIMSKEKEVIEDENKDLEVINSLKEENETLKSELESLKNQLAEIETAKKEQERAKEILEVVNTAIAKNKIKAESKQHWINLATQNFEVIKESLNLIEPIIKSVDVAELVNKLDTTVQADTMDLRKLEKENPSKVIEIYNNNRALYKEMYKYTYKVDYKD